MVSEGSSMKHLKDICKSVIPKMDIIPDTPKITPPEKEEYITKKYVPYDPFKEVNQDPLIMEKAKKYASHGKGFLILSGKNGTGKSFLAERILQSQNIYDTDYKKFITQSRMDFEWQKQIKDWGDVTYLLNQYIQLQMLVIDDLGTRKPTEAFLNFLYAIIDDRYRSRGWKGTIITTNLTGKKMREDFGDPFTSRVCSGEIIKFEGEDRRIMDF